MNRVLTFSLAIVLGLVVVSARGRLVPPVDVIDWSLLHEPGNPTNTIENTFDDDFATFTVFQNDDPDRFAPEMAGHVLYDLGEPITINGVELHSRRVVNNPVGPDKVDIYWVDDPDNVVGDFDDIEGDPEINLAGTVNFAPFFFPVESFPGPRPADHDLQTFDPPITAQYFGLRFQSTQDQYNHDNVQYSEIFFNSPEIIAPRYNSSDDPEVVSDGAISVTGKPGSENNSVADPEGGYWNMNVTRTTRYQTSPEIPQVFTFTAFGHVNKLVSSHPVPGLGKVLALGMIVEPEADNSVRISFVGEEVGEETPSEAPAAAQGGFVPTPELVPYSGIVDSGSVTADDALFFPVNVREDHIYQIIRAEGNTFETYVDGEKAFDLTPSESIGLNDFTGWSFYALSSLTTDSDSSWRLWELRRGVRIYKPGDTDFDGDVDFTDFSALSGNFTGTLAPFEGDKEWSQGDFDFDGDSDFTDFSKLSGNFTGTVTAPAGDTPPDGDVHLEINLETGGTMTLQPNNANLAGYSIRSPDSQLVPDADGAAAPFMFYLLNAVQEVTAGSVGATTMLSDDLVLDISFAGDADQAENVVFQYTRAGDVTPIDGIVHVIPEPTTLPLLALGMLMAWWRR